MNLARREPVLVIGTLLNTAVVMASVFAPGLHLTPGEIAAVGTISTALTSAVSAFLVKPANLGVIHTALSTMLVAAAAFGLHLSGANIAVVTGAVASVLGYLLREKVSPVAG